MGEKEHIYMWKGKQYLEQPKGTIIQGYVDSGNGTVYVRLRRDSWFLHVVLFLVIAGLIVCIVMQEEAGEHIVQLNSKLYAENGVVQLNLSNPQENNKNISVSVTYKSDEVVEVVTLEPGEEIGNIYSDYVSKLQAGSYMCTYNYLINDVPWRGTDKYDVLLIVR